MRLQQVVGSAVVFLLFLLLAVSAHAASLPPQAVSIDVIFIKAKTDGTGVDRRLEGTPVATKLKEYSKGSPKPTPPLGSFDSFEFVSRESRSIGQGETAPFPIPLSNGVTLNVEYGGQQEAAMRAEGSRYAITISTVGKSGLSKNKTNLKLQDGGSFLQGLSLRAGNVIAAITVTSMR